MLEVHRPFQAAFAQRGWDSSAAVTRSMLGAESSPRCGVLVQRGELALPDGARLDVFFKLYAYASPSWKFLGRTSKARREFQNYAVFAGLGIPCAQPVACGEDRDALGRLRQAFIMTRAIPGARTLLECWQDLANEEPGHARATRRGLIRQLAGLTQRIHRARFHHRDLVWRNILVTGDSRTPPRLWWIDCPRGRCDAWPPFRWHQQIKDLASLDKSAVQHCTAGERLTFLEVYLGKTRLDPEVKALAKTVLRYRRRRWPDSEPGPPRGLFAHRGP